DLERRVRAGPLGRPRRLAGGAQPLHARRAAAARPVRRERGRLLSRGRGVPRLGDRRSAAAPHRGRGAPRAARHGRALPLGGFRRQRSQGAWVKPATFAAPRLLLGGESLLGVSRAPRDRMLALTARYNDAETLAVTISKALGAGAEGL